MSGNDLPEGFDLAELRAQIDHLDGASWQVVRTLKSTPYEETQLVRRKGADKGAEAGLFVRKLFAEDAERGDAYEALFRAQASGVELPHIPLIHECTRADTGLGVVMEYLPGENLRDEACRLADDGHNGAGMQLAFEVGPALCEALDELHTALDAPIIHRDVKPDNVIMTDAGLKLVDLGIARTWREGALRDTTHFGTPGYAPPEQYGFGQTGVTGDIYAAGMTLAFCYTGEDPAPSLRENGFCDPRIPVALRPVLAKATQLDPSERYQSAAEMREAVQQASREPNRAETTSRQRRPTVAHTLKYLWNALVIAYYLFLAVTMGVALFRAVAQSSEAQIQQMADHPGVVVLAAVEVILVFLMLTVAAYLLLFKQGLRHRRPFNRFTWRQELPAGIGFIAFVVLFIYLMGLVTPWLLGA